MSTTIDIGHKKNVFDYIEEYSIDVRDDLVNTFPPLVYRQGDLWVLLNGLNSTIDEVHWSLLDENSDRIFGEDLVDTRTSIVKNTAAICPYIYQQWYDPRVITPIELGENNLYSAHAFFASYIIGVKCAIAPGAGSVVLKVCHNKTTHFTER